MTTQCWCPFLQPIHHARLQQLHRRQPTALYHTIQIEIMPAVQHLELSRSYLNAGKHICRAGINGRVEPAGAARFADCIARVCNMAYELI
jgi:hypothetical protein